MSDYMTAKELADMIDCQPNSYACMCRWLEKNEWPFEKNLRGFPKVSRAYHAARTSGIAPRAAKPDKPTEPNFSMFKLA